MQGVRGIQDVKSTVRSSQIIISPSPREHTPYGDQLFQTRYPHTCALLEHLPHFAIKQVALRNFKIHTFCHLSFHTLVFPGT